MHEQVRRDLWAYAADERLDREALIREEYTGIRPAPGYPACPEHSEKRTLFDLLDAPVRRVTGAEASPSISKVLERAAGHPDTGLRLLDAAEEGRVR